MHADEVQLHRDTFVFCLETLPCYRDVQNEFRNGFFDFPWIYGTELDPFFVLSQATSLVTIESCPYINFGNLSTLALSERLGRRVIHHCLPGPNMPTVTGFNGWSMKVRTWQWRQTTHRTNTEAVFHGGKKNLTTGALPRPRHLSH